MSKISNILKEKSLNISDSKYLDVFKHISIPKTNNGSMVSHPAHYDEGDTVYEPYRVIEAWNLNFNIGSAVKYLSRYLKKWNAIEDLEKAKQYIDFEIEHLKRKDTF